MGGRREGEAALGVEVAAASELRVAVSIEVHLGVCLFWGTCLFFVFVFFLGGGLKKTGLFRVPVYLAAKQTKKHVCFVVFLFFGV